MPSGHKGARGSFDDAEAKDSELTEQHAERPEPEPLGREQCRNKARDQQTDVPVVAWCVPRLGGAGEASRADPEHRAKSDRQSERKPENNLCLHLETNGA